MAGLATVGDASLAGLTRRQFLGDALAAAALVSLPPCILPTAAAHRGVRVHDLVPPVLKFLKKHPASHLDPIAFQREIIEPNRSIYDNFVGPREPESIAGYVSELRALAADLETLHSRLTAELDPGLQRFQATFPDFAWNGPIILMVNLFRFDAGTGPLDWNNSVIFGLDTIAKQYGPDTGLAVLISHELFHVYQDQFHPAWLFGQRGRNVPLYRLVWREGLATYVAGQMHPQASEAQVLFSPTLAEDCDRSLPYLASLLSQALDNTDRESYCLWMAAAPRPGLVPPRAGYYVGKKVASRLAAEYSPQQMARLPDAEIRRLMLQCLLDMQSPPSANGTSFASSELPADDGGGN